MELIHKTQDTIAVNLLTKLAKQRRESITQYEKADRNDLVEQEVFELDLISKYLPEAASEEDISQAIQAAIEQTSASSMKDMGKVMGILKSQLEGRADFGVIRES